MGAETVEESGIGHGGHREHGGDSDILGKIIFFRFQIPDFKFQISNSKYEI
jgi:hypothetical protein